MAGFEITPSSDGLLFLSFLQGQIIPIANSDARNYFKISHKRFLSGEFAYLRKKHAMI